MGKIITCVGFKVMLYSKSANDETTSANKQLEDRLFTLRSWMHWLMNSAADAWRYADKRASTKNPTKEVRDRGEVTQAVKDACERQRAYALKQLDNAQSGVSKLRAKLGTAKSHNRKKDIETLERELRNEIRRCNRFTDASTLVIPSAMRNMIVVRSEDAFKRWSKNKGVMAYPSFRYGQPIRFRDGDWTIAAGDRSGTYLGLAFLSPSSFLQNR